MYSKALVVFAVAALASANDIFEAANHTQGLKQVFEGHFEAQWAITRQSKDVFVNATDAIAKINVTDLRENKDGEAYIVSGGLGHKNVTISLKSPAAFRGFDFLVEVFAEDVNAIERGQRGVEEPAEIPQEPKTEDNPQPKVPVDITTVPAITEATTTTGVTGVHTNKPHVTGVPTVTGKPVEATPIPTDKVTGLPKLETEIPEEVEQEPKMQAFIGFHPPSTRRYA